METENEIQIVWQSNSILLLSVCPSYWDITAPTNIHNLRIDGYIRPTLSLDWPDFAIKSKISQISLHIPDHIRITILQQILLRRLILQPFSAYILVIHNGYYSVLDTGTMRTDRRMFQSSPV